MFVAPVASSTATNGHPMLIDGPSLLRGGPKRRRTQSARPGASPDRTTAARLDKLLGSGGGVIEGVWSIGPPGQNC